MYERIIVYTENMRYTEEDFESIYRATVAKISKHVFYKVQNLQDAQDLVQDLYYALYQHMQQTTEKIDNPQAYLIQMANHELSTYYRDKLRRPITLIDDDIDLIGSIPDEFDLETAVLDKIVTEDLWIEIMNLPDLERDLIIARYKFDMSFPEISQEFNLAETTIKSKVYKSLEGLKKKIIK